MRTAPARARTAPRARITARARTADPVRPVAPARGAAPGRSAARAARAALAVLAALAALLTGGCGGGARSGDHKDPRGASASPGASPRTTFVGVFSPEDGSTVGSGLIVSLRFSRPITDRAAVEHAVTVTSRPARRVVGHWFGAGRLDLRPADFWPAGAHVTLTLRLAGVRGAPGVYGRQDKSVHFTVARDQRSTVDVRTHTMTVVRDGVLLRTLPITAGSPEHTTYNGIMVITEKYLKTRMNGSTVGFGGEYDIPDVPHAMRLTASGTFVHGNYWSPPGVFGAADVSHGCVGLPDVRGAGDPDTPAAWFYDHSLIGDPVRVLGSDDAVVAPDNGLGGWNLDWPQWTAGSALR